MISQHAHGAFIADVVQSAPNTWLVHLYNRDDESKLDTITFTHNPPTADDVIRCIDEYFTNVTNQKEQVR